MGFLRLSPLARNLLELDPTFPWIFLVFVTYFGLVPPISFCVKQKKVASKKKKHVVGDESTEEEDSPVNVSPQRTVQPSSSQPAINLSKAFVAEA